MKPEQLELLIFTSTRFASKQFHKKYERNAPGKHNVHENLEDACWDGLFREMLPGLCNEPGGVKKLTLWKVTQGNHFLDLEYAVHPQKKEKRFSVDPYLFLQLQIFS